MNVELFNAIRANNINLVRELIATGVDPNLQYSSGYNAYMIASEYGLNPGFTALMLACDKGYLEIVNALINAGANIDLQDIKEFTALDIAIKKGNQEIIDILSRVVRDAEKKKIKAQKKAFYMSMILGDKLPHKNNSSRGLYSGIDYNPYLARHIADFAFGEGENEGAEESKSNRGDAGSRRKKSKSKTRKSNRKKSKSKKSKRRKSIRKKSKSKRSKKSKRRKSFRK